MKCLTFADAEVEFAVKQGAKITKSKVMDLRLPENIGIGGLTYDDKGIIATETHRYFFRRESFYFAPALPFPCKVEKFFK